jgi:hypothetical protein
MLQRSMGHDSYLGFLRPLLHPDPFMSYPPGVRVGGETFSYFGLFHDFLLRQCPLPKQS